MPKTKAARKADRAIAQAATDLGTGYIRPTDEREAFNTFVSAGMAKRMTPVIDTLLAAGKLTPAEHARLNHYRDQASRAEDDVAQASTLAPERMMGGGGTQCTTGRIPASLLASPAILETARIERDLQSLRDFTRAIVVDDMSLTRWCCAKYGGRERYDGKGKFVALVPMRPDKDDVIGLALLDLKYAAGMIVK
jgi:hypothetical protein